MAFCESLVYSATTPWKAVLRPEKTKGQKKNRDVTGQEWVALAELYWED